MKTINIFKLMFVFSMLFCVSCSSGSEQNPANVVESNNTQKTEPNLVDSILGKMNESTRALQSFQCEINYKFVQPSVFDAQTIRKGILYYSKIKDLKSTNASGVISKLRVNFQTLQQDEDEEQEYKEQYIVLDGALLPNSNGKYKGLWLIQMNYESKNCKYIRLADTDEPNKPVDVFELLSKNLPIVGFTKTDRLKEEFDISAARQSGGSDTDGGLIQVQLKVKPNSVYNDDYLQIDCLVDEKLSLPVGITAISTEPEGETPENKDLSEIKFINPKVNEKIDEKVFDFEIPDDFGEPEVIY